MRRLVRGVAALSPRALFFGPVFAKDVRTAGRRRVTHLGRAGYAAALLGVLSLAFLGSMNQMEWAGAAGRLQTLSNLPPIMAMTIGWVQFIALTLLAPALTAPSLCEEKTKRTLAALVTTPLTSAQIVFGKLSGRMMEVVILALIAAPALLLLRVFGGLDAEVVLGMTAVTLSSAMLSGALGLYFALWRRRAPGAVVMAVLTMILWCVAPMLVALFWFLIGPGVGGGGPWGGGFFIAAAHVNPVMAMAALSQEPSGPGAVFFSGVRPWITCTIATVALALGVGFFTAALFRRNMRRDAIGGMRAAPAADEAEGAAAAAPGAAGRRAKRRRRARTASRVVGDRPVLWRELRMKLLRRRRDAVIVAALVCGALVYIYFKVGVTEPVLHAALAVIACVAQLTIAATATTGAIASERETQTWEVLLTTPLSGRQIVYGKLFGAAGRLAIIPGAVALHFIAMWAVGAAHWIGAIHAVMILAGYSTLLAGLGILLSISLRKASVAGALNLAAGLGMWLVAPMLILALLEAFGVYDDESVMTVVLGANPTALIGFASVGAAELGARPGWRTPYDFFALEDMGALGFTWLVGASSAAAAGVGALAAEVAVARFRARSGRSS